MRRKDLSSYTAHLDGHPVEVQVADDALVVDGRRLPWLDMDEVQIEGYALHLQMADQPDLVVDKLGRARDDLLRDVHAARSPARRAGLLQSGDHAAIDSFESRTGEQPTIVSLFPDALTIEPPLGPPTFVPLSLVEAVDRDGYSLSLRLRHLPAVTVAKLGPRTDEFLADLEAARSELAKRTSESYSTLEPSLGSLGAPDGWALSEREAGQHWPALRNAVGGQSRAAEVAVLNELAGDDLRLGIKCQGRGEPLTFALAPVGAKVAVEGTDTESRATFVFATDEVERLNVVLLLVNFRREALYLPDGQLGRWAMAVRISDTVRWARSALADRVVHDARWEQNVRAALVAQ